MNKGTKNVLVVLASIFLLTPLIIYVSHFYKYSFSNNTEIWGQFGDYLNGTFMPIIALVGVIVTLLLGLISNDRNKTNLKIDQQKQRPLLHIGYFDYEDKIRIFMKNKGNGPLIIFNYRLVNIVTGKEIPDIFSCLPKLERLYNNYSGNQNNTVLSSDEETELLLYEINDGEVETSFEDNRQELRRAISQYKIVVDYKDVYDNVMPTYSRSLEWFGRNLNKK